MYRVCKSGKPQPATEVIPAGILRPVRENGAQAIHRLVLLGARLVRVNLMLRRDLLNRHVIAQRLQRHPGLELRREPAPLPHRVSLRHPVE